MFMNGGMSSALKNRIDEKSIVPDNRFYHKIKAILNEEGIFMEMAANVPSLVQDLSSAIQQVHFRR